MKIENLKLKIVLLLLFAICYSLFAAPEAQAEGVSLGIDPSVIRVNAISPANVLAPLTLYNLGDNTVPLTIMFKPFTGSDQENGQVNFSDISTLPDSSILQRINILDDNTAVNEVTLAPKQAKKLTLQIKVPNESVKGDYYFSIIFVSKPLENSLNSSQSLTGIASNVLLSIGSNGETKGFIQEFSVPFFLDRGPVPFTVRVKNSSNHFITTKGNIVIKNIFGQTVGKIDLSPVDILADSVRSMPSISSDSLAYWPEKFLLGPYNATINIALSDQGPLFTKQITFFALPLPYLVGIFIALLVIIYISTKVKAQLEEE